MKKFIPFEIAKKLEEKGFKIKQGTNYLYYNGKLVRMNDNWNISPYEYAPTIDEVLRWLREEKEIDIDIYPIDANTVFMGGEKYILSIYINRKRCYKIHHDNIDKYVQWEEAALAGIEYVLNNLIM